MCNVYGDIPYLPLNDTGVHCAFDDDEMACYAYVCKCFFAMCMYNITTIVAADTRLCAFQRLIQLSLCTTAF